MCPCNLRERARETLLPAEDQEQGKQYLGVGGMYLKEGENEYYFAHDKLGNKLKVGYPTVSM